VTSLPLFPAHPERPRARGLGAALARAWRRLRRQARPPARAAVVYHPNYEHSIPGVPLDPARGEKILGFLSDRQLLDSEALWRPRPASVEALLRVHDPAYLEALDEQALTRILGVGLSARAAQRVVDVQRLMTGGTVLATRAALAYGVAVNLGGGFHHALRASGQGFCIFNDVAVAIGDARQRGLRGNVLVVDLDLHDGNGTRALFAQDPSVHTYSIHNANWGPPEGASTTCLPLGPDVDDARYLATLESTLPEVVARVAPKLAFFLAGCDLAEGDALGNWRLSAQGLLARDRFVLHLLREGQAKVPLVIVLAGGYGQQAWRFSARTLAYVLSGQVVEPPGTDEAVLSRYRRMGRALHPSDWASPDPDRPFELTEDDLVGVGLDASRPDPRFLDVLSRQHVELLLERLGLLARLRDKGFDELLVTLEPSATGQTLRIFQDGQPPLLLVELRVRRTSTTIPGHELAMIEWLLLQDPRASFGAARERLPDQQYPGLGMVRDMLGWLTVVCERLGLEGVTLMPSHYHTAVRGRGLLRCVAPRDEAYLQALVQALAGLTLAEGSRALAEGRVRDRATGTRVDWEPHAMALPVAPALERALFGPDYAPAVAAARASFDYVLSPAANPG
jgi:acetoin utilization deacetylase AcuC-like enzyme